MNQCYTCTYRGTVPGDAHSCCNHPDVKKIKDEPLLGLLALLHQQVGVSPASMNIKANPHGVKNGWFNFPFNFDPVWLENCDGWKMEDSQEGL